MKYKYTVIVDTQRCKGCGICLNFCPREVFEFETYLNEGGHHPVRANSDKCIGCRACVIMCPDIALELVKEEIDESIHAR
ncbi:MAG: 4Fe-4S dicluster domain-containing protein [bacterium]